MKRIVFAVAGFLMVLALVVAAPGASGATSVDLDFTLGGGATLSQGSGLAGTIPVTSLLLIVNGIQQGSPYSITDGLLTFSTGSALGGSPSTLPTYSVNATTTDTPITWSYGAGGSSSISLTGGGIAQLANGSTLFSGVVNGGGLVDNNYVTTQTQYLTFCGTAIPITVTIPWQTYVVTMSITGNLNASLGQLLDISPNALGGAIASFQGIGTSYGSGLVALDPDPVPIPSALMLLAPGLLGLIGLRKRFKR